MSYDANRNKRKMRKEIKVYHICNLPHKVIFRDEDDYLVSICRLAACAFQTGTEVWAYSFMSTHFHLIVRTDDIESFIKMFKINLSRWHNHKYNAHIRVNIGKRELNDEGAIRIATNYVLKNPVHHGLVEVASRYPYSSVHIYFRKHIAREPYYQGEYPSKHLKSPCELGSGLRRRLFGSHMPPDTYKVQDSRVVLPETFVNDKIIESLYKSVRNFLYNMTKPMDEEIRMFGKDKESINSQESRVSLFGKLTDIQACSIIDKYIHPKTYTQVTSDEKAILSIMLREKGSDKFQIERCL